MGNTLKLEDLLKPDCLPDESAGGENWRILHGDTLKLVKGFQPGIFDAVVTDPPYASGGTKQNERNRTTNQKYSSMKAENALPDFDGDNKDQRSWTPLDGRMAVRCAESLQERGSDLPFY